MEGTLGGTVGGMAAGPSPVGDRSERGEASTSAVDQHVALHRTASMPVNAGTAPIPPSGGVGPVFREGPLDMQMNAGTAPIPLSGGAGPVFREGPLDMQMDAGTAP